jgi:hypothetical protein
MSVRWTKIVSGTYITADGTFKIMHAAAEIREQETSS